MMCIYWCCRETLRNILLSIYANKKSVDETLVEVLTFSTYVNDMRMIRSNFIHEKDTII